MHTLNTPLKDEEVSLLRRTLRFEIVQAPEGLTLAVFFSPEDLLLAQTLLADFRYGPTRPL